MHSVLNALFGKVVVLRTALRVGGRDCSEAEKCDGHHEGGHAGKQATEPVMLSLPGGAGGLGKGPFRPTL